jgi:NAD(P)-dependent dehydrogenase (short-subunit alcohol dehydrogenase family)
MLLQRRPYLFADEFTRPSNRLLGMAFDYSNKIFVITGAAGGIGSHLANEFAQAGAIVVALDLNETKAKALVSSLPGTGHLAIGGDLTDRDHIVSSLAQIDSAFGRIDVLIPNAAITTTDRFDERSSESIERELDINLTAPLVLMNKAIPLLRKSSDPRIVTTVSLGGIFPLGETPMYTASKFGLRGAILSLALDLEPKGIKVGAILPSATDTPMLHREAVEGGNSLQFLDPPQSTEAVLKSFRKMLDKPTYERYPKPSESWLVRAAMLAPNALPKLMPLFRGRGEKGHAKFLADLEQRGLVRRVGDQWEMIED